jgi:hypothetical protein
MNWRKGLLRVWIALSALWLIGWASFVRLNRLDGQVDGTRERLVAYQSSFRPAWTELSNFTIFDYLSVIGIGIGVPIIILCASKVILWVSEGFRGPHQSN